MAISLVFNISFHCISGWLCRLRDQSRSERRKLLYASRPVSQSQTQQETGVWGSSLQGNNFISGFTQIILFPVSRFLRAQGNGLRTKTLQDLKKWFTKKRKRDAKPKLALLKIYEAVVSNDVINIKKKTIFSCLFGWLKYKSKLNQEILTKDPGS